jgi:tetratricopeptide (TPR) repeat protein
LNVKSHLKQAIRRILEAARFFNQKASESAGLSGGQHNNNDTKKQEEWYNIGISLGYHLFMSGRDHETSYKINKGSARYLCYIGNLDLAESCYKRAISEADHLGRIDDKMGCLFELSNHVYQIWGRYDEALANYQSVLKYYYQTDNLAERSAVLRSIAEIYDSKGDDYEAMKMLNESLEINRKIDNQIAIGSLLNGIALIHRCYLLASPIQY